ncbi:MAG: PD-(D/E)XK nuclease family protein [Nanopusillaceae archaeon]
MYLSFSKIDTYTKCGIKYYLKYVKGISVPPSTPIILGQAIHHAFEKFFFEKLSGNILSISDILDVFSDKIDVLFSEEVLLSEEEKELGLDRVKGESKDAGIIAIKVYYNKRALNIEPFLVEQEFQIDLHKIVNQLYVNDEDLYLDTQVKLIGYFDLITTEKAIHDLKIKTHKPKKDEADKSQQLTLYTLAYKELLGEFPEKITLENIILPGKSNNDAQIVIQETKRTEEDIKRALRRTIRVVNGIRKGVYIPPDQSSWLCQYCGYRKLDICKDYIL